MKPLIEFDPFPKISRLSRGMIITEKIDGSSGTVFIDDTGGVFAASRNRWITPEEDNYGFAKWVAANKNELIRLGPGYHRGEFWGLGIQRGYGLKEKRFSLFDVNRWGYPGFREGKQEACPNCCHVVPVLYRGIFDTGVINHIIDELKESGSKAAPGFLRPEGIVIYHTASKTLFKKTVEHDEAWKGQVP